MIRVGTMNRRLTILRTSQGEERDEYGVPISTTTEVATVWAERIPKSEDEAMSKVDIEFAISVVTFRIWFRTDLKATDGLRCEGVDYDITGIRELGFRERLEVTAEARTAPWGA